MRILKLVVLMLFLLLATVSVASAHETRGVEEFSFEVGWLNEPAIVETKNGIDLHIADRDTSKPIIGAEKTLKAEASTRGKKIELELRPQFGRPGAYTADVIPTVPGTYIFRFFGTLTGLDGDVHNIDVSFESGERFASPVLPADIQFPEKLPTINEVQKNAVELKRDVNALQVKMVELEKTRDSALAVAIGGLAVGIIGIALGTFSLRKKVRPTS